MKRNLLLAMSIELSSVELIPVDLEEGRMGLPSILEYLCGPSDPVACLSLPHLEVHRSSGLQSSLGLSSLLL